MLAPESFLVLGEAAAGFDFWTPKVKLFIFVVQRGICRIDDVSIVRVASGTNIIPNAGFDRNTTPWRIAGTHIDSRSNQYVNWLDFAVARHYAEPPSHIVAMIRRYSLSFG